MNWEAIGAVGEIVGAMAVVISLVYLASQIRIQNTESQVASMHEISEAYRDSLANFADGEIAAISLKANNDFESLTDIEVMQLIASVQRVFRVWEEAFIQFQKGRLDTRMWRPMNRQFLSYLSFPFCQRVWELRNDYYDEEFVDFVNSCEKSGMDLR